MKINFNNIATTGNYTHRTKFQNNNQVSFGELKLPNTKPKTPKNNNKKWQIEEPKFFAKALGVAIGLASIWGILMYIGLNNTNNTVETTDKQTTEYTLSDNPHDNSIVVKPENNPSKKDKQNLITNKDTTVADIKDTLKATGEKTIRYALPKSYQPAKYVIVKPGDNLWNIAKRDLIANGDTAVTDTKIRQRVNELIKINDLEYSDTLGFGVNIFPKDSIKVTEDNENNSEFWDE